MSKILKIPYCVLRKNKLGIIFFVKSKAPTDIIFIVRSAQFGNRPIGNLLSHFFGKNYVKATF